MKPTSGTCAEFVALVLAICPPLIAEPALYFPPGAGEWARVTPADANWDSAALDAALEYAGGARSSAVVVLLDGRILAERYWNVEATGRYGRTVNGKSSDGRPIEDVASVQKSVIAFLAGIAAGNGQLELDAPADRYLGAGWSKAAREDEAKITVRHLMTMTSGLNDSLDYLAPAGTVWRYNTGAYSRMVGILEKATGKDIATLTREQLTAPTGMSDTQWARRPGPAVASANNIGLVTTARDLARFGLMILADGAWDGADLLGNPDYFDAMLSPTQELNPSYGLLWWLNGQGRVVRGARGRGREGSMIRSAPDDLVAAQGALGRKCYVVPSLNLVVTRLGDDPGDAFNEEFWRLMMKAVPPTR